MLGHSLSGALMQLEATKVIRNHDGKKADDLLNSSISIIRSGIDSIRHVLRETKPNIQSVGIKEINVLLEKVKVENGININFIVTGDTNKITIKQMECIYSNIEEALSNSIKYSKCTKIVVELNIFKKLLKLSVKDNGVGVFNLKKGMGIKAMEERVLKLKGSLNYHSENGFIINTLLPIEGEEND